MAQAQWEQTICQLNIVIIGAGLGGLALAIQCALVGHKVRILEQAAEIGEIGAGIQIPPQSSRILGKWGLHEELSRYAVTPSDFTLRGKDGKVLSLSPVNRDNFVEKTYGSPYWVVHRADFHRALLNRAVALGVQLSLGAAVDTLDFEAPCAYMSDGSVVHADLIMGCDGLKSRTRELLVGHPDPPVDTGDIAYRILVPASEMRKHKELHVLLEGGTKSPLNYWMGPDGHVVCYLLKGGDLYNIVLLCPDDLPDKMNVATGTMQEMLAVFEKWDPRLKTLLSIIDKPPIKWKLQNHPELATWTHPQGKVALLGDACHPTLPYLASGAAMAVEDGAALGLLLSKVTQKSDLKHILGIYENIRKTRTTNVVQRSTHYQTIFHCHDGPEQQARDDRMLNENPPKEGNPNQWADPVFQRWLWGYKVEEEVERAWTAWTVSPPNFKRLQFNAKANL